MAIILPHGVLFRGGAEERIRTKLFKDGHIDTVIGLPAILSEAGQIAELKPKLIPPAEGRHSNCESSRDGMSII